MRTWVNTEPPFWARPAMSIMPQPLPSRCAAMPSIAPTVTTPVPPTPSMIAAQPSLAKRESAGIRHAVERIGLAGDAVGLADLGAMHGDEGRAEAVDAGEILVAARLVDLALAAEFGLDRLDRDAVRLHAAIAAAFADQFVDEDALVGIGKGAALAAAAFFGGAGLVVEQHRDAFDVAQLALDEIEFVAVMDGGAGREFGLAGIFVRLVGDDGDALDAFGAHLPGDHVDVRPPSCGWPPVMATASL